MSRKSYGVKLGVIRHRSIDTFDCPDRATANRVRRALALAKGRYLTCPLETREARLLAETAAALAGASGERIIYEFEIKSRRYALEHSPAK